MRSTISAKDKQDLASESVSMTAPTAVRDIARVMIRSSVSFKKFILEGERRRAIADDGACSSS